jgi:hypothetical protein
MDGGQMRVSSHRGVRMAPDSANTGEHDRVVHRRRLTDLSDRRLGLP